MKEYNKILIPTDGSSHAELAIKKGIDLASLIDAEVLGLYVLDSTLFQFPGDDDVGFVLPDGLKEKGEHSLQSMEREARDAGVKFTCRIVEGHPAETIIEVAKEDGCDMIVIGTMGLSGLKRLLLGSVAENVVRNSQCPVIVVRNPDDE